MNTTIKIIDYSTWEEDKQFLLNNDQWKRMWRSDVFNLLFIHVVSEKQTWQQKLNLPRMQWSAKSSEPVLDSFSAMCKVWLKTFVKTG